MPDPILRSFSRLEDATNARDQLIAAGFQAAAVQLRVVDDEAGPAQGNFLVGNGREGDSPYEKNFRDTIDRGAHLLLIEPGDDEQRNRAELILERLGAIRADPAGS
jgi:hypothetical protein